MGNGQRLKVLPLRGTVKLPQAAKTLCLSLMLAMGFHPITTSVVYTMDTSLLMQDQCVHPDGPHPQCPIFTPCWTTTRIHSKRQMP